MLIGVTLPDDTTSNTRSLLDELRELVDTLGFGIRHERMVSIGKSHAKLRDGTCKLQKQDGEANAHDSDIIIVDNQLAPTQQLSTLIHISIDLLFAPFIFYLLLYLITI